MTNRNTKRALLVSVMAMLICVSMLVGTTFAWFTDTEATGKNIIKSGNLDVELSFYRPGDSTAPADLETVDWKPVDGSTEVFHEDALWEPGYTQVVYFKVENKGSLALKYNMSENIYTEKKGVNVAGNDFLLSDYLYSYVAMNEDADTIEAIDTREAAVLLATEELGTAKVEVKSLKSGETKYGIMIVTMPTTVGNEANHKTAEAGESADKYQPVIGLGITLVATQEMYEDDSFGNDYDKDADYVTYYSAAGEYNLFADLKATVATDVVTADGKNVVLNIGGGSYDAGDQDCAVWAKNGAVVNIYGGEFTHNGNADGSAATSANHFDMIYAGTDGVINIYGGFYSAKNNGVWLLNEKDNSGVITVYGGTFVNWNPADNVSEGAGTNFLAAGYHVETATQANGDIWYTVVAD